MFVCGDMSVTGLTLFVASCNDLYHSHQSSVPTHCFSPRPVTISALLSVACVQAIYFMVKSTLKRKSKESCSVFDFKFGEAAIFDDEIFCNCPRID